MDRLLKGLFLSVGVFVFFAGLPSYAGENSLPVISISRTKAPPVIDGKMTPGEWDQASGVTGFLDLYGKLVPHQTFVYVTYDDKKLYFAFQYPFPGNLKLKSTVKERDGSVARDDAIEIWLNPGKGTYYQFLGNSIGTIEDYRYVKGKAERAWNGNWEFKSKVEDSGETTGGILTFAKKIWTAEIAISFKDLGVSTPREGETWRVNFTRDIISREEKEGPRWTTWSNVQDNFNNPSRFGYLIFRGSSPVVQVKSIGDLSAGDIRVDGQVSNFTSTPANLSANLLVVSQKEGKKVIDRTYPLSVAPGKTIPLNIKDELQVSRPWPVKAVLTLKDSPRGHILYKAILPFTVSPSFQVKVVPFYFQNYIKVEVNTKRLGGLSSFKGYLDIEGAKDKSLINRIFLKDLTLSNRAVTVNVDISKFPPGDYAARAYLLDNRNKVIAATTVTFPVPKKPAWLGNRIGLSAVPPPPWSPVKVKGNTVFITQREYRIGNNGLPQQIISLGKKILTEPARLRAVLNGKEVSWKFNSLKKTGENPNQASWEIRGTAGPITLTGALRIEYDGFSLYSFTLSSSKPVTLNSLVLEFPLKQDFTLYARGSRILPPTKRLYATLYKNVFKSARAVDMGGRGIWLYNPTGWKWPYIFLNEVWVGDDKRGFSLMSETDENIIGKKYAEFIPSGKETRLRINLVSKPVLLKNSLTYEYAYQATPVKPEPSDPKRWHASYSANWPPDYLKRLYVGAQYHLLAYKSYPKLSNPAATARMVKNMHKYGAKIVPDFYVAYASPETPEFKLYGPEWEAIPRRGFGLRGRAVLASPRSASFRDFVLYTVKRLVEDFHLDGIYNDSAPSADENPVHGAGYTKNGKRYPTLDLWATRELYKRIYTYLHTGGRDGVVFGHTMHQTALAGFQDVVTEGEEWSVEKGKQYRRLSPDMFRAKEMKNQYGTPFTWYIFHQYVWRGSRYGTPVPFHEILMMGLVHRILPTIGDKIGGEKIIPIWDLMDNWWTTSEFIPYWNPDVPVKTGSEEILASTYLKQDEKQALVVVSNWKYGDAKARVSFDFTRFGFGRRLKITDAFSGKNISLDKENNLYLNIPKRNFKLMIVTPE